jgi:hypothetical protein
MQKLELTWDVHFMITKLFTRECYHRMSAKVHSGKMNLSMIFFCNWILLLNSYSIQLIKVIYIKRATTFLVKKWKEKWGTITRRIFFPLWWMTGFFSTYFDTSTDDPYFPNIFYCSISFDFNYILKTSLLLRYQITNSFWIRILIMNYLKTTAF